MKGLKPLTLSEFESKAWKYFECGVVKGLSTMEDEAYRNYSNSTHTYNLLLSRKSEKIDTLKPDKSFYRCGPENGQFIDSPDGGFYFSDKAWQNWQSLFVSNAKGLIGEFQGFTKEIAEHQTIEWNCNYHRLRFNPLHHTIIELHFKEIMK